MQPPQKNYGGSFVRGPIRYSPDVPLKLNMDMAKVWRKKIFYSAKMSFSAWKNLEQPSNIYIYFFFWWSCSTMHPTCFGYWNHTCWSKQYFLIFSKSWITSCVLLNLTVSSGGSTTWCCDSRLLEKPRQKQRPEIYRLLVFLTDVDPRKVHLKNFHTQIYTVQNGGSQYGIVTICQLQFLSISSVLYFL